MSGRDIQVAENCWKFSAAVGPNHMHISFVTAKNFSNLVMFCEIASGNNRVNDVITAN